MRNVTGSVGKWLSKGRVIAFGMSGGNAAVAVTEIYDLPAPKRPLTAWG